MQISLSDIGKRFNRDWIFRKFSYQFTPEHCYAITGPNGSGKSTLLQVIAGAIMPSEGSISYRNVGWQPTDKEIEEPYSHLSIAAPYQELIEEMTLLEFLAFHRQFKPFLPGIAIGDILSITGLGRSAEKQIRYYSSGMKQRVKLAQAVFSETQCVLLDEPTANLDEEGIQLYRQLIETYCQNRLVIISSNDKLEYGFCDEVIDILRWKM